MAMMPCMTFAQAEKEKSPSYLAQDVNGKLHRIEEFRGKYIYIDIWATWCGPCRNEIPYLKELEKHFEKYDIAFVSLSIDEDKNLWNKAARMIGGNQFWIGPTNEFITHFGVRYIPRFLLIAPSGNVINADMTRPSDPKTLETLKRLLVK